MKLKKIFQKKRLLILLILLFCLITVYDLTMGYRLPFQSKMLKKRNDEIIKKINEEDISEICFCEKESLFSERDLFRVEITLKPKKIQNSKEIWYCEPNRLLYNEIHSIIIYKIKNIQSNIKINEIKSDFHLSGFLLNIFMILHTPIFMFYIISTMILQSGKLNSNPLVSSKQKSQFTFKDVAGNEEEKEEMKELIDFLKQPQKYEKIGASIPKGVLLEGPPGTGKTLLAKALAGESKVPFYAVSGSEFVEMYVGVGASRVRKLFKEAKNNAPCVLFIDEIDVLGSKRSGGGSGGSQEREQTLNQLLTEMDGFTQSKGIIIIGATNRADILDPALLRPGRFDRKFIVGLPDVKAREAILKVHCKNKKIADNVDFHQLAKQTPGMSGAQLGAVLNEASILTVRAKKNVITMNEFQEAIDRVWFGPAKKSRKYTEKEKRETAYHEAGHAVVSIKLQDAPKLQKITIIPRGKAGGYVLFMQEEELFFESKKRLQARIVCSLGARAAEEMMFGDENISDGCYDDLKKATNVARLMVTKYGMSDLGLMQDNEFIDKMAINKAMQAIMEKSYQQAQIIIKENKDLLDKIATKLLEQEIITREEIEQLLSK